MVLLFIEHYVLIVFCQLHALSHFGGDHDDCKKSEEKKSNKIDAISKTFHAIDLNDCDLQVNARRTFLIMKIDCRCYEFLMNFFS